MQRHLAGAFQDNRIIPYEGVNTKNLTEEQRQLVLAIAGVYFELLPEGPHSYRLRQVQKHLDNTHFCWIGGFGPEDAFYYRIQNPVMLLEFDHHSGVFLTNEEPQKYHIHTIQRMPNGNDYGRELIRLYRERHASR